MWKVVVLVLLTNGTLGHFTSIPSFQTKAECMEFANKGEQEVVDTLTEHGFRIEDLATSCEQLDPPA